MHKHIRTIIKENNPHFYLLAVIERFLKQIKDEHNIHKIKELEIHLIEEAKKNGKHTENQAEFLKIVNEFIDAFNLAFESHKEQKRETGERYIVHPIHACLNEIYHQENETHTFNEATIIAALLHDTIEDTDTKYESLLEHFGPKIADIVKNLTDNPEWHTWSKKGHISKLEEAALQFVNASKLEDSLDVKFDDRLSNLETIDSMPEEKIVQKIIDTISVGYIERAEELKEIKFLKVLYRTMDKHLTEKTIQKYFNGDKAIESLIEKSRRKIYSILLRLEAV